MAAVCLAIMSAYVQAGDWPQILGTGRPAIWWNLNIQLT